MYLLNFSFTTSHGKNSKYIKFWALKWKQISLCVEIWLLSKPMENLIQPDSFKILPKFDIHVRWINFKHFQIFYFGNKYLTGIICLVLGCDISMLVKDDKPDRWNAKTGIFKILIYGCHGMHLIIFSFTTSHGECSCHQNEAIGPIMAIQSNIGVATEANEKIYWGRISAQGRWF